jgi:hypothetical protein
MNRWDLFTYAMAVVLGVGSLLIFIAFLLDLRDILKGKN